MHNLDEIKILVIDDEKIIREGSERILTKEGWKASMADNGSHGLEILEKDSFQIVLLDLMMPGISGMDVLKTIQPKYPDLLVIVITGYATIENAVDAMKNGAYDFIPKPFTPDQLRIVVKRAIEKLNLTHEAELLRREQEQSLKYIAREKSKTLTIINNMADGVIVTDQSGSIVLHNPAVMRMLEQDEPSSIEKVLAEWSANKDFEAMVEEILSKKDPDLPAVSREITVGNPPQKYFMARCAPIPDNQGETIGTVTLFHDVTWFKELDRLKSDFVNMVSHEIRSPLSSMRQKLSLIDDGFTGDINKEQSKILTRVQNRIDGLIGMTNNLLELSRIESGRFVHQRERLHIPEIVDEVIEILTHDAEQKGVSFDVTIDSHISHIHADRQSMETVVMNLLNNAIKYNREGGTISFQARNREEFIEILVSDTGVGISQDDLPRIFDKFFRIRSEETRKVIGSGIGLPLVKEIIEAHHGTISVESTPGKGTAFTVLLPQTGN